MVVWTDDNTRVSPTTYDMDGDGTPLRDNDIVILREHQLVGVSGYDVIRPEDYQIILTSDRNVDVLLSFVEEEGLTGNASWKFEATGPPPDIKSRWPNLYRALVESGISIGDAIRGPYGEATITWDNGDASGLWSSDTAWAGNTKPAAGDAVVFDGTSTDACNMDAVAGTFLTWTITTSYTGTITLNADSTWSGALTIDFGGAGTFAGTSKIIMTGAVNLACDQTIPSLEINAGANTVTQTTTITTGVTEVTAATLAVVAQVHNTTGALSVHGTMSITTGTIHVDGATDIAGTLGANQAYTLNMDGNLSASAGTLSAPSAAGAFTFSGATWTTPTTFTANSGVVTFDLAGTTTLGNDSTQFYAVTVKDGATLATSTYNITVGQNLIVGDGASGVLTTSTGTKTITGTTTINAGATLGSAATTYTLDMNGNLAASAGTLIAPQAAGSFTYSGATWLSPTTFTHSSGTVTFDLAGTTTLGNASTQFANITVNAGTTLDTSAASNYAITAGGSTTTYILGVFNTNASAVSLSVNNTATSNSLLLGNGGNINLGSSTVNTGNIKAQGTSTLTLTSGTLTLSGKGEDSNTLAMVSTTTFDDNDGTIAFTNTGFHSYLSEGSNTARQFQNITSTKTPYGVFFAAGKGFNMTIAGNLNVVSGSFYTGDTSARTLTVTGTTTTAGLMYNNAGCTFTFNGTVTISSGGGIGSGAVAYTLDMNANLLASVGTLVAPTAGSSFTYSGATWLSPTTFTHNTGTLTFDLAGTTTLGNASTQFQGVTVDTGTTLDTSGSNYALTCAGTLTVTGVLTTNVSTISARSGGASTFGLVISAGGTLNGGSGTYNIGGISNAAGTGTITFSTGTTNINGIGGAAAAWSMTSTSTLTFTSSTIVFSYNGAMYFNEANNTARIFNNVTINVNSNIVQGLSGKGMDITVGGNLLISSGFLRMEEQTSLTAHNLTVTGTSTFDNTGGVQISSAGTAETYTFNGTVTINSGGQLRYPSGGTVAHVLEMNANLLASAGTLYAPNGSATFNYSGATWLSPTAFTHQSGTVTFDLAGTTTLGNDSTQFSAVTISNGTTLASSTYNYTAAGAMLLSATSYFTTSTGTKKIDGTLTITGASSTFGTATTTYTLDLGGTLATSTGVLIAPQAAGTFTFAGATWNTPTTFTHSSGLVTFDLAGTTTLGNASIQFYSVTVSNGTTLAKSTLAMTLAANLVVGGGASGALTVTATGALTITGTTTINAGATLGSATTAYTLDMDGNLLASAGTLINTTGALQFTFSGATWNTPTTFTHSNNYVYFDRAGTTTLGNDSTQFYTVYLGAAATLNTSAAGNYSLTTASLMNLTGVLTCNASTVSIGSGTTGVGNIAVSMGGATATLNGGSGVHTYGTIKMDNAGQNWSMSTGGTTLNGYNSTGGPGGSDVSLHITAGILTHNNALLTVTSISSLVENGTGSIYSLTINSAGTNNEYCSSGLAVAGNLIITAGTLQVANTSITVTGTTTVNGGVLTAFTSKTLTLNGTTTINGGATLGTATRTFTLDMNANLLASAGTLIAPQAAGTFTYSGATWLSPTVYTHSTGTLTFDLAGTTTLGNASIQFNAVTVSNGTTLSCHASNYALTCAGDVIATGTLNGTGAAISLKDLTISVTTGVYTATSATTTITGKDGSSDAWVNNNTFTHSNGKVDFTGTGASYHIHGNNGWYDLEISLAAASTYLFMNGQTQTINNSTVLTGAAGQLLNLNSVSGAAAWLYTIVAGSTQTHTYLDVHYSDASGGDMAMQTFSTNGGDNTNWNFGGGVAGSATSNAAKMISSGLL
jgi:hypothetical protein